MEPERGALTTKTLARIVDAALDELGLSLFSVELALVPDRRMRALNRERRGKDTPTDVLSFPMYEAKNGRVFQEKWERTLPDPVLGAWHQSRQRRDGWAACRGCCVRP